MISAIGKVVVPVDDQESAKRFWTEMVGFELATDEAYGDERWVEVSPPGDGSLLVLSPRPADQPRPEVPDALPHSPVLFTCSDIQQTQRELAERGIEFAAPPQRLRFGWWTMFVDQDGTRYALGQWG
jgi:predicted enzyme related to lactoylglutathione lyase